MVFEWRRNTLIAASASAVGSVGRSVNSSTVLFVVFFRHRLDIIVPAMFCRLPIYRCIVCAAVFPGLTAVTLSTLACLSVVFSDRAGRLDRSPFFCPGSYGGVYRDVPLRGRGTLRARGEPPFSPIFALILPSYSSPALLCTAFDNCIVPPLCCATRTLRLERLVGLGLR